MLLDAIIIGGSYAGLSAALPLARARRRVLVIDAGLRRNRFSEHSHGFLGQDGVPPGQIAAQGREQLLAYPTVEWKEGTVRTVSGEADGFIVALSDGSESRARRLILATGVIDELPDIPGLAERWGKHVFHCPYCHGYELNEGRIGVLAGSQMSMHQALMLPDWGRTTLFLNGSALDLEQQAQLEARGVAVEEGAVAGLEGEGVTVAMQDGRAFPLAGLFVAPRVRPCPVVVEMGCALEETPLGDIVKTDQFKATSIPGVFACGDMARAAGSVPLAVGDGAMAGTAVHRSLMFGL
ncbi:thioredoxin reductase [Alkalilimnicola ehrlichii]|uniref:Thioredoxin reductase n=1 Tax=Alkalilimnicola ehrlichii TaxID=351052 RepID=A0A3E0WVW1_9GAMM|nr:NAD(P)/FAD-dependent oxidoreductase [Alkalilimnicola ehrlichii]RFA29224.1 thioredoxin reductase [Alkalilimnicola ehrlichii]RFA36136.1 thioredoxin reductase [Alkalilimnicola ehrlichii]